MKCQNQTPCLLMGSALKPSNPIKLRLTEPQSKFIQMDCRHPLFVAGFGAGKTETMVCSAVGDAAHSASALIGMYAPTYDLIRLITAPRLCAKLSDLGVPHKHNKAENIIYTSYPRYGDFILRTMENPARIVGYETYRAHADELDTLKEDAARLVWNAIIARNRQRPDGVADPRNRVSAYTTPEGFRFVYDRWVRKGGDEYQIIQAPTLSNPFLPDGYVENLRNSYPPELIDAYLEGRFVNLTSGTVYRNYDREKHRSDEAIIENEPLHIGQDFNVNNMTSVVMVKRGDAYHAVDELVGILDTPQLVISLQERYRGHQITIYPDASGDSRKTVNASTSDIALLRKAGFIVRVDASNPRVKDRILAMNSAYSSGRFYVNDIKAPTFAEAQEQQAYDKNGEPDKTTGHDHPNDAAGYAIVKLLPVLRPSFGVKELTI